MIKYVSDIADQIIELRSRTKKNEKEIGHLRKSGKDSVETMLGKLYTVRKDQEKADKALSEVHEQVKFKEEMIKNKENAKSKLNERIADQKAVHEAQFEKLRVQLDLQS